MFTFSALVQACFGRGWVDDLSGVLFAAVAWRCLGPRRAIAASMGVDQLLAWPVFFFRWPHSMTAASHPRMGVLLAAWSVVFWLLTERPFPDKWLTVHGIRARMLLAGLALAAIFWCNPLTGILASEVLRPKSPVGSLLLLSAAMIALLHLPLWHVLVFGWKADGWEWRLGQRP